jgi:hypothetical protein
MSDSFKSGFKSFIHDDKFTGFDAHKEYMAGNEDIEHCISKHKILDKARKNGSQNLPAENAEQLDSVEQEVVLYFTQFAKARYNNFKQVKDAFDHQIYLVDTSSNSKEAEKISENFKENLNLRIKSATNTLKQICKVVKDKRQDLKNFQIENNLDRSATPIGSHFTSIAILLFVLIAEILLNGYFFAQDSDFGLMGGGVQALIFALLNILACCLLARSSILINHVSRGPKSVGWMLLLLLITWLVFYNLMVAHYRDALMALEVTEEVSLVDRFLSNGINFEDSNSIFLWLLGIVFGAIAAWEGFRWDDSYPGYGRLTRTVEDIENSFDSQRDLVAQEIQDMREKAIEKLKLIEKKIHNDVASLNQQINSKRTLIDGFRTGTSTFVTACSTCIIKYRDANRIARDDPEPDYFKSNFELELQFDTTDNPDRDNEKLHEQTDIKDKVIQSVQDLEISIINQAAESFKTIHDVSIS